MNPLSPSRIIRICLVGAAALVLAAPAGAKGQSSNLVATYGWGAAATFAKQQMGADLATPGKRPRGCMP